MNDLKEFDLLTAEITLFVAPVQTIRVNSPETSQSAIDTAKGIKEFLKRVEEKRKELVAPLNNKVKFINDFCRTITAPLLDADSHVRSQLNAFAAEQEKVRREEEARIEAERIEAERLAQAERQRVEAELIAKMEAESEVQAEAINLFGTDDGDIEKVQADIVAKQEREWAEKQAELDREAAARVHEFQVRRFDADQKQIKNTRATLKVRVVDINAIPKEFLIVTPNEKALLAAGKAGVKIAGVEFYEDISVAIGSKTRMPGVKSS